MQGTDRLLAGDRESVVRVAACTPRISVGDPASNAQETLLLLREGERRDVDLMLFPELGISAYAIDDLLLQDALLDAAEAAIARLVEASRPLRPVFIVGAPVRRNGRPYNCGIAIRGGRVLGVTPKSFLPNYREFYEARWFAPGAGIVQETVAIAGQRVPFGPDLIFAASAPDGFVFHIELCEDFWSATPPSSRAALAGALILCNLSASNIVVGKARDRALLCASQSIRCHAAYVYSAAGPGESTTDLAWDGQASIHELGEEVACTPHFPTKSQMCVADIDAEQLRLKRMKSPFFENSRATAGHRTSLFRYVCFEHTIEPPGSQTL